MPRKVQEKKLCSFPGCSHHAVAKTLCNTHWAQQHRQGKLTPILVEETPEQRFWRQIKIDTTTNCWLWTGSGSGKFYDKETGQGGYGQLRSHGKNWMAHRWAYVHLGGKSLEQHEFLDHTCRNTRCCNPEHLENVSREENNKRAHLYSALKGENKQLRHQLQLLMLLFLAKKEA
jgi:hypothetical protein